MKIKTNVKAGEDKGPIINQGTSINHNQTVAHGLKINTNVKAGGVIVNERK